MALSLYKGKTLYGVLFFNTLRRSVTERVVYVQQCFSNLFI